MDALTVTAKGQVTLKKDLLRHLGVRPGEQVAFDKLPGGRLEVRAAGPTGNISDAFNSLKSDVSLSIDDMNEIIADGWAGKR
jgi:bifunctional DNA-binding transcriptional regulator/antitoxin component of YhaV-PrlF toxin-antitoxin module